MVVEPKLQRPVTDVGLRPVRLFADGPAAVVQGLSMTIGWSDLAEAALAIRAGALWVTANLDAAHPRRRGLLPGNGSLVALPCVPPPMPARWWPVSQPLR